MKTITSATLAAALFTASAAPPSSAEGFHAEERLAIAACQLAIKANHPGGIRWFGHEIYFVDESGNDRFARFGYRAKNSDGVMFTRTEDCPINPLPETGH